MEENFLFFEGLNLNNNKIINLAEPKDNGDAITKKYFENKAVLLNSDNLMKANIDMSGTIIFNLPNPTGPNQPSTKSFLENKITKYVKKDGTTAMRGNLQMSSKKITDLADPDQDNEAVNKGYLDRKVANVDLTTNLKRDGSQSMTGNLQMGDHTITGIRSSSQDNAALTVGGAKSIYLPLNGSRGMESSLNMGNSTIPNLQMPSNDPSGGNPPDDCALNFKYFHSQRGDLERKINEVGSEAFSIDGSDPMGGNLDMNNHEIINIKEPQTSNSQFAATVNYVNKTVSDNNATIGGLINSKVAKVEALNIKASKRENVFSFVMDDDLFKEDGDDITKVGKVDKDFYDINQATYQFKINYDSKIGYYSTGLTIDLKALDIGEFTLVFEIYYDKSKIDKDEVVVDALSSSLNVSRHNTNKFDDYSRTIINFHKYGFLGLNDLDIDITLKNKS